MSHALIAQAIAAAAAAWFSILIVWCLLAWHSDRRNTRRSR